MKEEILEIINLINDQINKSTKDQTDANMKDSTYWYIQGLTRAKIIVRYVLNLKENKFMKKKKPELTEAKAKVNVEAEVSKPKWYIKPMGKKGVHHGCLNCGGTEQILDLSTRLYNSFGGWMITKDDELYFEETDRNKDWNKNKTLKEIEKEASKDPDHDWRAVFDLPLRGGEYQRHAKNKWVLIKSNQGFA